MELTVLILTNAPVEKISVTSMLSVTILSEGTNVNAILDTQAVVSTVTILMNVRMERINVMPMLHAQTVQDLTLVLAMTVSKATV